MVATGIPLAHTSNCTPFSAYVRAKIFDPGFFDCDCIGAAVEFDCAIVVCDGAGVWPAAVPLLLLQAASAASTGTASQRKITFPCMLALFPRVWASKQRGPGRIRTYAQPVMSRPLYR